MPDLGQRITDERVEEINKRLLAVYSEAAKDLQRKTEAYIQRHKATEKRLEAEVKAGKKTQDYLDRWKAGQVFIGKQWQSKVDQMARSLVDTEKQAVAIVNGEQLNCFADNANYFEYRIDKDSGFAGNFSLYDETTVKGLIEQEPELMRRRYVDGEACEAWNRKIISNCITQGILQGEKISEIAKRIARDTASTDMKAMVRYARTAMTCAQNAGRLQTMHDCKKRGIYCKKVWLAVDDDRTREAHSDLDGQTAEIDEPFDSILGEIMYPGDPNADDANVWNCRCALGYEYPDPPADWQEEETIIEEENEDFGEWVESKQNEAPVTAEKEYTHPTMDNLYSDTDINPVKAGRAFGKWVEGDAYGIRQEQQTGNESAEAKYIEQIIASATMHYSGMMHRGIVVDGNTLSQLEQASVEGKIINMLGTSSWSSSKAVSDKFADEGKDLYGYQFPAGETLYSVVFHTNMPENNVAVDIEWASGLGQEEVILSKEAEFTIRSMEMDEETGTVDVYLHYERE